MNPVQLNFDLHNSRSPTSEDVRIPSTERTEMHEWLTMFGHMVHHPTCGFYDSCFLGDLLMSDGMDCDVCTFSVQLHLCFSRSRFRWIISSTDHFIFGPHHHRSRNTKEVLPRLEYSHCECSKTLSNSSHWHSHIPLTPTVTVGVRVKWNSFHSPSCV